MRASERVGDDDEGEASVALFARARLHRCANFESKITRSQALVGRRWNAAKLKPKNKNPGKSKVQKTATTTENNKTTNNSKNNNRLDITNTLKNTPYK